MKNRTEQIVFEGLAPIHLLSIKIMNSKNAVLLKSIESNKCKTGSLSITLHYKNPL